MDKITEYIKTRRKSMGMSQEAVSNMSKMSLSTYKRREVEGFTSGEALQVLKTLEVDVILAPKEGKFVL